MDLTEEGKFSSITNFFATQSYINTILRLYLGNCPPAVKRNKLERKSIAHCDIPPKSKQ